MINEGILKVEQKIIEFSPDTVLAIADGLVPAGIICTNYGIRECYFWALPIHRDENNIRILPPEPEGFSLSGKKVLIVDDHTVTGTNLEAARRFVEKQTLEFKSLVLFKQPGKTRPVEPDIYAFDEPTEIKQVPWSITSEHKRDYHS